MHKGHGDNDEVVLNYGASPGSGWMFNSSNANNADMVVTFESDYDTYTTWAPAAWEASYPASRLRGADLQHGRVRRPAARFGVRFAGQAEHRQRLRGNVV